MQIRIGMKVYHLWGNEPMYEGVVIARTKDTITVDWQGKVATIPYVSFKLIEGKWCCNG